MTIINTQTDSGDRRFVDSDLFKDVIGHFASGVTVITTRHEETNYGLTASAVTCLSIDPPMLLVCIYNKSGTSHAIANSKVFGVNILHEDQGDVAIKFAKPSTDKFEGVEFSYGELGEPLLKGVLANIECRLVEVATGGTHSVFLAEVQNAWAEEGTPLTYYRGKFGRFQASHDETIYRRIRRMVLEREFQVNQKINITELTHLLDAPRQSVYYGITRLEAEGLIDRKEDGDYSINPLDSKSLNEALDTRCALEIAAVERTVGQLSDAELIELRKRMKETQRKLDGNAVSIERYIEANTAFHDFIVALAKNATLLETYRHLTAEAIMTSALRVALEVKDEKAPEDLDRLTEDHSALTKAFEEGNIEEARRIVYRHTQEAKHLGRFLIDSAGGRI
jgi:flavin reductase (DIM6/NTAB) family NADH-FMN oxidoreductase RutF/DNA-binding GntR family transcriptional regulator